jgi:S1-C subfamily serine protease
MPRRSPDLGILPGVDLFDLLVGVAALGAIVAGYRVGFTTRVLSWLGLGVGLVVGLRAVPWLLDRTDGARYELVVGATIAIVLLPAVLGETAGFVLGRRVAPHRARASRLDQLLGGVGGLIGVLATVWMILPVLAASAGWPSELVANSTVAQLMTDHLPAPPDVEEALPPLVGDDTFPKVFEALPPRVTTPPPAAAGLDAATTALVAKSVVKIGGVACRITKVGTGFVIGDALVVTNAHVVAGEGTTSVERDDGRRLPATVVAFDPDRDLALLAVTNINRPALPLGTSNRGDTGGVFGHPEGGPLRIAPFELVRSVEALGNDIYGKTTVRRQVLELAAALQHGDSGSALVDTRGEVVGIAFAVSASQATVAYALANSELSAVLEAPHVQPVSTGPCLT